MISTVSTRLLQLAVVACFVLATATSYADTFGSGVNTFDIEFVTIGDPGNPDDTTGSPNPAGSVVYTYRMGKFEVSEDMITKYNDEFGAANGLVITKDTFGVDQPVTSVSWNEAARFVNWLNTSSGGFPVYNFTTGGVNDNISPWTPADTSDYDAANPYRSRRAKYALPSMDEWYKAAYYNPATGMYGAYPSSDGTVPTAVASGTADKTAVFDGQLGAADITQAGGLSAYGIMALGGNVWEWEETAFDLSNSSGSSDRGVRGGNWENDFTNLSASVRFADIPTADDAFDLGFRVVSLFVLGDANGDGVLTNDDILPFVQALTMPAAYAAAYPDVDTDCVLDINQDGSFTNDDILGFVTLLTSP